MKDAYELINHTLVSLINEIWELEEKAIITEEFKDLSNNDMHVIEAIGEVAEQTLPEGYSYEFGSSSREQSQSDNTIFILIISTILVYLLLCSLYESFFVPLAVICSIPFGIFGCFLAAKVFNVENNIYLQTGMIMIIGLLAKTAILITQYASEARQAGMGIGEAAFHAAKVRLRPILMTVLTLIFGMLPLLSSTGAGANGNRTLGAGVVGGMLIGTIALLLVVPLFFVIFQKLQEKYGLILGRGKEAGNGKTE